MKKFLLLLSLSFVALFASPAYVYKVESYFSQYEQYLYEPVTGYTFKTMNEARPSPSTGYILPTNVNYFKTLYVHEGSQPNYIRIYVYFPYSTSSSTDVVGIRVRNFYKLFNGYNGITIKDYYTYSSYILGTFPQSNGSKVVVYSVPDTSDYYKEITVTTCPNGQLPTAVNCQFAVVDIAGSDDYGLELR